MSKAIRVTLFGGCILLFLWSGFGQSRKELERQRNKKEKEIAVTKKKLEDTKRKKEKSVEVLSTLREQISQKRELVGLYLTELEKIDAEIERLNLDVSTLNFEIDKLKKEFGNLVYQGFKSRHATSKLNFIFSARTFPETIRRFVYLKKLLDFRKKQLSIIQSKKYEKAENLAEMEQIKDEKLGIVKSNEEVQKELEQDENSAKELVQTLQIKESGLQTELKKKEKAYRELDAALKRAIEKEIELARKKAELEKQKELARIRQKDKAKTAKQAEAEYVAPTDISSFGKMKGKLQWPMQAGYISQGFGTHRHPTLPDVNIINNGINLAGTSGSAIKSVFEGEVSAILLIPGMKNTLLIKHGDFFTVYSKLETVTVSKGEKVKTGQKIGTLGTDSDGKTELHFEVWQGNQRLDPQKWLHAR